MYFKTLLVCFMLSVSHFCRATNLTEGSPCKWGSYNGTCTNVYKCLTFVLDKMELKHPPVCSFQNKVPIICCTACPTEIVANISNAVFNVNAGLMWRTGSKSWDACVDYNNELPYFMKTHSTFYFKKIWNENMKCHNIQIDALAPAGGEDTKKGEFPFMALLGYGTDLQTAQWLCGGSLIHERFILTAAHCISSVQFGPVRFVALGVWKRSEPNELWQRFNVKRIIPHPDYKSPSKYHDIAILETDKPVNFNPGCLPICLHSGMKHDYPDFEGLEFALGWGSLGPGKHLADILQKVYSKKAAAYAYLKTAFVTIPKPNVLQYTSPMVIQVNLQSFTDEECAKIYQPHRHLKQGYNNITQMCYGDYKKPRDTCEGDSGGPLLNAHNEVSIAGQYTVIGVTSYGVQCGVAGGAGIYTRVSHYLPWIESIVWP